MSKQKGFSAVALVAIIAIISITALAGWYIWVKNQKADETVVTQPTTESTSDPVAEKSSIKTFSDTALGVSFDYPESWGETVLKKGELIPPAKGNYSQVLFISEPDVRINLVTGPGGSPLDGCPYFLDVIKHHTVLFDARTVGFAGGVPTIYDLGVNQDEEFRNIITANEYSKYSVSSSTASTTTGTVAYGIPIATGPDDCSGHTITQSDIDEAKALASHVIVIRNSFTGTVVKGANARISNAGVSDPTVAEVETLLKSLK